MSADIRGVVFFKKILKDGEINPDSGNERLQEDDGEFLDDASHFTTDMINNSEYHDISENITDRTINEDPPEEISEGGQDSVQTDATSVENPVSNPISKNALPLSEN